jgi:alkylated DNA repair dioxygenase AlkB
MPGIASKDKPGPTHGFSYQTGWVHGTVEDKQEGDPQCLELATNLHANLVAELHDDIVDLNNNQQDQQLHIPYTFNAHSLWARQYTSEQALGFHVDPPACQWAFIISLGCDTVFQVFRNQQEKEQDAIDVTLKSGDAIFFNGSLVQHGIKQIVQGTQPAWWTEKYQRVGLQMRGHMGQSVIQRKVPKPKRQR